MKNMAAQLGTRVSLIARFASAGLLLELSDRPVGGRVEVINTDKKLKQLVLLVHEPPREFEDTLANKYSVTTAKKEHGDNWVNELLKAAGLNRTHLVRANNNGMVVRRETSNTKRHYLCGLDERQLFIAELPQGVSTVRDARDCLKATEVKLAEGTFKAKRQGEWFFLELPHQELEAINRAVDEKNCPVARKVPLGRGGHPHVAEELVTRPGQLLEHDWPVRPMETYVRGKIRHEEHKTVEFDNWVKVIRNTEPNAGRMDGIAWID
jgi:hypothetical protein